MLHQKLSPLFPSRDLFYNLIMFEYLRASTSPHWPLMGAGGLHSIACPSSPFPTLRVETPLLLFFRSQLLIFCWCLDVVDITAKGNLS